MARRPTIESFTRAFSLDMYLVQVHIGPGDSLTLEELIDRVFHVETTLTAARRMLMRTRTTRALHVLQERGRLSVQGQIRGPTTVQSKEDPARSYMQLSAALFLIAHRSIQGTA